MDSNRTAASLRQADNATLAGEPILDLLERRLGRRYARQRLGIEKDHEAQIFGQGINFFHIENLKPSHALIRAVLMATGMYWRGAGNAGKVKLRHNRIVSEHLPRAFDGYTILQLSDLHVEMSQAAMRRVTTLVDGEQAAGPYTVAWDGTAQGVRVAPGMYFVHLVTPERAVARQLVLVR